MIPKRFITQWQHEVPWISELQVEQDLLISRVLVELYNNKEISNALAFRED